MSICLLTRCWRRWAAIAAAATTTGRLHGTLKPLMNSTITNIWWGLWRTRRTEENCILWNPIKFKDLISRNVVPNLPYRTIHWTWIINNRWPAMAPFSWLYNWRITVSTCIGASRWSTGWGWIEWCWPAWSTRGSTCTCTFRWRTFPVSPGCVILTLILS